jgi:large subunit ribosomal protein L11
MTQKTVETLVDGGKATPAPPLGPSLAQFKVNVGKIVQDINEKTKSYEDMKVPVKIIIDDETKEYSIEIGTPPISSLIRKELGLKKIAAEEEKKEETPAGKSASEKPEGKGEEKPLDEKGKKETSEGKVPAETEKKEEEIKPKVRIIVGNLTIDQCIKITKMKRDSLLAKNKKKALKEVVASCVSMPITVEGKSPKDVIKDIDAGLYDDKIENELT